MCSADACGGRQAELPAAHRGHGCGIMAGMLSGGLLKNGCMQLHAWSPRI